jgi:hypothetical protein
MMGMYTELILGAKLKKETPEDVINTLKFMIGMDTPENFIPIVDFGRNPLIGGSFYFAVSSPVTNMYKSDIDEEWQISTRANIKNYNDEIEKFLEWLKPTHW